MLFDTLINKQVNLNLKTKITRPSFDNDYIKFEVKDNYVLIEKSGWVKLSECIPKTKYIIQELMMMVMIGIYQWE